jgi:tetratricopeptide (TPR) repeat protein
MGGCRGRRTLRRGRRRLRLARYWHTSGDLDQAARYARRAWQLVGTHPAPPLGLAVEVALAVARIERDLDRGAASRIALESALAMVDAAPAGTQRDRLAAATLTDLADCHRRAGRYPLAVKALGQARYPARVAGAVQCAATLMVLGIVAKELGRFAEAARWYARVGLIHAQAGCAPGDAAALCHNLAGLAHAQQQYPQAEMHARRAVALRRRSPRVTPVDVAADLAVVAAALAGQARYSQARMLLSEAMLACCNACPPRRYEVAVHLHNLAAIDQACGRLDEAERGYRQALALKEHLLGPAHPEIGLLANNLGTLLHQRNRGTEAAACYRRALTIVQRGYPRDHPTLAAIRHNLDRLDATR